MFDNFFVFNTTYFSQTQTTVHFDEQEKKCTILVNFLSYRKKMKFHAVFTLNCKSNEVTCVGVVNMRDSSRGNCPDALRDILAACSTALGIKQTINRIRNFLLL